MRATFTPAIGAMLAVLVLTSCSSSAPETSPQPGWTRASGAASAPEATPAISPAPTMTTEDQLIAMIPEAAKGDDLPAAIEMAKFFITLHPGLYQGEDPALFQFLSLPECTFCNSSVEVTQERVSTGLVQVGGEFTIPDQIEQAVLDTKTDNTVTALVGFTLYEEAWQFVDGSGGVVKSGSGSDGWTAVALRFVDGMWRIYGVELV